MKDRKKHPTEKRFGCTQTGSPVGGWGSGEEEQHVFEKAQQNPGFQLRKIRRQSFPSYTKSTFKKINLFWGGIFADK